MNFFLRGILYFCIVLVIIGGINWGLYAINKNVDIIDAFGNLVYGEHYSIFSRIVYGCVAIASLILILFSIFIS